MGAPTGWQVNASSASYSYSYLAFGFRFLRFLFFIRSRSRASNTTDWWKLTGGFCLMAGSNGYVIFMVPRFCLVKNTQSGANDFRKKRNENGSSRFSAFCFFLVFIRSRSRASPGPDQQALCVFLHSIGGERDPSPPSPPDSCNRERMHPKFSLPGKRLCSLQSLYPEDVHTIEGDIA